MFGIFGGLSGTLGAPKKLKPMSQESPSNPPDRKRVLVADDHPIVRDGLVQLINQQSDLICCGQAANQMEVFANVAALQPQLLVLDMRLKDSDGLELIKSLKAQYAELPILVLSQFDEELYAERALRAGALGYVMKEQASKEVVDAMRTVLAGKIYVTPAMTARLLQKAITTKAGPADPSLENLTDRELQVLQFLGTGLSTREIAAKMRLSIKTVETYREHLKHKLGLRNAEQLVYYARNWAEKSLGSPRLE
jgi:DNA-binding NarL/FixJ family response regulator